MRFFQLHAVLVASFVFDLGCLKRLSVLVHKLKNKQVQAGANTSAGRICPSGLANFSTCGATTAIRGRKMYLYFRVKNDLKINT